MQLPLPALLLLLAAVRPGAGEAAGEAPEEAPGVPGVAGVAGGAEPADFLSRQLQSLSELVTRELPPQLRPEELRNQAGLYLQRANAQLEPLARELQNNLRGLLSSLLQLGRRGETPETP